MKKSNSCEKEKAFSSISRRSFITVVSLLVAVLVLSGALSYVIPRGSYDYDESGLIIDGTFRKTGVEGIAFWRVFTAPVRVFVGEDALTIIMISIFLLVMSGVFNLIEKTGGIKHFIGRLIKRLKDKGGPVVCISALVFMLFGSFFGMFEELVTLVPIMVMFMLTMGMDSMTGLGACMLAACFGFSAAITNPFSVGLASQLAGTAALDGAWLRVLFFTLIYGVLAAFLMIHLRTIEKDPTRSPTYESDLLLRKETVTETVDDGKESRRLFRVFACFFAAQAVVLVLIAAIRAISGFAIPILSLSFLVGGIIAGLLVTQRKRDVFLHIGRGAVAMLPAVLMIAIASSVKLVMTESGIIDTITHGVISTLDGKGPFLAIVLIYLLILVLQLFIGSASAKIFLVMPIILPICRNLGISPELVILTYCMADGFTDVILPTNPVLLVGLSMANVSYGKWVKWTWKLQTLVLVLTLGVLYFATLIGY